MAYAATLRTRNAAENVFVRARRCGIVRKNSTVWRFFWSGYSGPHAPSTAMESALTSSGCFAPGVSTTRPVTHRLVPTPHFAMSL